MIIHSDSSDTTRSIRGAFSSDTFPCWQRSVFADTLLSGTNRFKTEVTFELVLKYIPIPLFHFDRFENKQVSVRLS